MRKPTLRPRATINVDNQDLAVMTNETWEAIAQINDPPELFSRGGSIVLVDGEERGHAQIHAVTQNLLRWYLTQKIDFVTITKKGEQPKRPPLDLFQNILATPSPRLPILKGITQTPVHGSDGLIQLAKGYSSNTKLFHAPAEGVGDILVPSTPSAEEVNAAIDLLRSELLGDFPFVDRPSIAHALAAALQPFVRPLISGPTPIYLITKPQPGTGGTLLADILSFPACGWPSVMNMPNDEGERRRALYGVLQSDPGAVVLDNVVKLEGAALACCMTQEYYQDRVVGSSKMGMVSSRCLWLATGNNVDLTAEMGRRAVPIYLDARAEHPDLGRSFRHPDLKGWAGLRRTALVRACLVLTQAWVAKGMPDGFVTLGGFESWSRRLSGILEVARIPGFLSNITAHRAKADTDSTAFKRFVRAWAEEFGECRVTVAEVLSLAGDLDLGRGENNGPSKILGKLLASREGQRFDDWTIRRAGSRAHQQWWRLEKAVVAGGCGGCDG